MVSDSQAHSHDRQRGYQTAQHNQQMFSQIPGSSGVPNRYYVHSEQSRNGYSNFDYDNDYDERHAAEHTELQNPNVYQRGPVEAQSRYGRSGTEWHIRQQYHRTGPLESEGTAGTAYRPETHPDNGYKLSARQPLLPTLLPLATSWDNPFPVFPSKRRPTRAGEQGADGASTGSDGVTKTSHGMSYTRKTNTTTSDRRIAIVNESRNPPGELQVLPQSVIHGPPSPSEAVGNSVGSVQPGSRRHNQLSLQTQGVEVQQQPGVMIRDSDPERQAIRSRTLEENSVLQRVTGKASQTPARINPTQNGKILGHPPPQDSRGIAKHYGQEVRMESLYYLDQDSNLTLATWDSYHRGVQAHNNPDKIPRHTSVPYEHRQDSYEKRGTPYTIFHNGSPAATDTRASRTALESMGTEIPYHAPDQHPYNAHGNALTATVLTDLTCSNSHNGWTVCSLMGASGVSSRLAGDISAPASNGHMRSSLPSERPTLDRSDYPTADPRACAPPKCHYASDLHGQYSRYGLPDSLQSQRHGGPSSKPSTPGLYDFHPRRDFYDQHERSRQESEAEAFRLLPMRGSAHPAGLQNEVLAESVQVPWRPETAPPRVQTYSNLAKHPLRVPQGLPVAAQNVERPSRALHQTALPDESKPDTLPQHPLPVRMGLVQDTATPQSNRPRVTRQPFTNNGVVQGAKQRQPSTASVGSSEKQEPLPITHEELERLRIIVKSNPSDFNTQLLLAKRMVEGASVLAEDAGRADPKTRNRNRERYIFDAHKLVKKLVSHGYAEAMFYLADCYGQGLLGLEVDVKEAFSLYQSAAKAGHPTAAYRTAVCCEMGPEEGGGTRKDPSKAVQWYKRAATLGSAPAMYKMGMILLKGLLGQQKNPSEAISWLKRAAERADEENPHALHELGILYESATPNDKLLRDEAYALQLFKQAADLNYKYSQCRLGQAYEYGQLGCAIDARSSIAWYSRAAAQGEHQAELALSGWYLTGSEGILEHSDTEAYLWARKAACAEPPLPKAMFAMGYYTEVGIGCPRSLEEAKRWYGRAASYKFPKAQERLEELKKGGTKVQKHREKLTRNNQRQHEAECKLM